MLCHETWHEVMIIKANPQRITARSHALTGVYMQDSLAGGSKVVMLLTVNPCDKDAGETLCSLNFAARLRGLELGPVQRNIRPTDGARQIELQQQLDTANTDVADALKRVHELEEQVAHLQEQLTDQEVLSSLP
jgi:kinesin family protein C2/C3